MLLLLSPYPPGDHVCPHDKSKGVNHAHASSDKRNNLTRIGETIVRREIVDLDHSLGKGDQEGEDETRHKGDEHPQTNVSEWLAFKPSLCFQPSKGCGESFGTSPMSTWMAMRCHLQPLGMIKMVKMRMKEMITAVNAKARMDPLIGVGW